MATMMELAAAKEVAHQLHRTSSSVQKHRRSRGRVVEECQQSKDAHEEDILRHERYVELLKVLKEDKKAELDFSSLNLGPVEAQEIAEVLKKSKKLQYLNLFDNRIGEKGLQALSAALRENSSLTALNLKWNDIGADNKPGSLDNDQGVCALAKALGPDNRVTKLTQVNLEWNKIEENGRMALVGVHAPVTPRFISVDNGLPNDPTSSNVVNWDFVRGCPVDVAKVLQRGQAAGGAPQQGMPAGGGNPSAGSLGR